MEKQKKMVGRRRCSSSSLAEAHSPTTAHVKEYVKRLSCEQINVYPQWNIQAMDVEMRRQKVFEECRLRYSRVLGKEWGDESKRKAAEDIAKRGSSTQLSTLPDKLLRLDLKANTRPQSTKVEQNGSAVEKPLPKLPVPNLSQTMQTYLKMLKPISTAKHLSKVSKLVDTFVASGEGIQLQQMLETRAKTVENWAYDWWLDDMYLQNPLPLPINSNPGLVFPRTRFVHPDEQLKFAARLVSGILDYKVIIDARGLPIDRARHREKGQPLCMEQYYRLFSSYREPGVEKDYLKTTEEESHGETDHIIVFCQNKMYRLDVVHGFNRLTEDNICCQLRRIRAMARENIDDSGGLGILTTLPRNEWAQARATLMQDATNKESLKLIESSIFILCLDKSVSNEQREDNSLALQMLHGQGSHLNSCNRWYDKTMQFIVGEDGTCGLNYEHSPSEGIAVVQLIEHVLKYMEELKQRKLVRMDSNLTLPYPTKLQWNVNLQIIQHTDMARFQMDRAISDLDLFLLKFDEFGKEFSKSQNMSPDCFIQLALQLTYFRLNGNLASTYESASTRRFQLGRVDNIRAASQEALDWCISMQSQATCTQQLQLLRKAMQAQTDIMVQTILGQGMDCHMLGLKRISEQELGVTPELFQDSMWSTCNKFVLSTSQVNTSLDSFMGYGPVVRDGYGVSYNPQGERIIFCISSFKSFTKTDSKTFGEMLAKVLLDMRDLCVSNQPTAAPRKTSSSLQTIVEKAPSTNGC